MKINQLGFSLVELIVVIMIITSLTALGITSYGAVQRNARNTERKTDLKNLQVALEAFHAETGAYPCTWSGPGCATGARWFAGVGCSASWSTGMNWIPGLVPNYINPLPLDPRQNTVNLPRIVNNCNTDATINCYIYQSNTVDYKLAALCTPEGTLNANDPFVDPSRTNRSWAVYSSGGRMW